MSMKRLALIGLLFCMVLALPRIALAHAILVSSTPAENAQVHGPNVRIELRFNSRVDGERSRLLLVVPGGKVQGLPLDKQKTAATLDSHANLEPGSYAIRWEALSTDGHITRGEIPFSIR